MLRNRPREHATCPEAPWRSRLAAQTGDLDARGGGGGLTEMRRQRSVTAAVIVVSGDACAGRPSRGQRYKECGQGQFGVTSGHWGCLSQ